MVIVARGNQATPGDLINLTATFYGTNGQPTNTDTFPTVTIVEPSGLVSQPISAGIQQINVGQYLYQYQVGIGSSFGVFNDIWSGSINGIINIETLSFIITDTNVPALMNSDGYVHLGDDPGFQYDQLSIRNINKLIKGLKSRMNSAGKSKKTDTYGNVIYVDCDIFSIDQLVTFIALSLSNFNQIPYFTFFNFNDSIILDQFFDIIVEGAALYALSSQALIEQGRQYNISDNGISFTPPNVAEMLNSQYGVLLASYNDRLKYIKNSMRPAPIGLGGFFIGQSNPMFKNLRLLRERQIF